MNSILKISEATVLAIHTMFMLGMNRDKLISTREIATSLDVSENHLAKVLQKLVKAGFANSIRGPKGGFELNKDSGSITLLDIYELIEGKIPSGACLLSHPICDNKCVLGDLLTSVNNKVKERLSAKTLNEIVAIYQKK